MATETLRRVGLALLPALLATGAAIPSTAHAWYFPGPSNVDVAAGPYHSCRVDSCGTIECWGRNDYGQSDADQANYVEVTVGDYHTCGLRGNGAVECWGRSYEGQAAAPSGAFAKVDGGYQHTCGLRTNDTLACWGANGSQQSAAPAGAYLDVSAGRVHSCAVTLDGEDVRCWGNDAYGQTHGGIVRGSDVLYWYAAGEEFEEVSAGGYHTCARSNYDTVYCWGYDGYGAVRGHHPQYPDDPIAVETEEPGVYRFPDNDRVQVSAGAWGTCSVYHSSQSAFELQCWGWPFENGGAYQPPATWDAEKVSVGSSHACFMDANDDIDCWGGYYGTLAVPDLPGVCLYEIEPFFP